jgi:hypothetical protein
MPEVTKEVFDRLPNVSWKHANGYTVDRRVHLWVPVDFTGCDDRFWYEEKPTPTPGQPGDHVREIIFAPITECLFRGHRVDYHPELRPRFIYHDVADDNSDFRA